MASFDQLRRRVQAELFAGMPEHIGRLRWSAGEIAARQVRDLRVLLAHAVEHAPFHARRLRGIDPESFELDKLAELPVMTKADLMAHFDDSVADRRITLALAEQALAATAAVPVPLFGRYVCFASGGSSGVRGVFVWDEQGMVALISTILRSTIARLAAAGGPPPGGLMIAMVAAASAVHATGSAPAWMAGSPITFTPVPVTLRLAEIVERLNALQPDAVYGYPSMLARLAREQQAGRLRIAPRSITTTGEMLLAAYRAAIAGAFKVPLVNTFGSTEGLIGHSAPDDAALSFNTDVCIIELVDRDNRPVPVGTPSAKVLITNLANRAQPLIRYELGDRFVRLPDAADHGHLRATVEGRSNEVLHFAGVDIHPLVITSVLLKHPEIGDYQIRQTARGIDVAILTDGSAGLDRLGAELRSALAAAGLANPDIAIDVVSALDSHPETGKLRRVVPLRPGSTTLAETPVV